MENNKSVTAVKNLTEKTCQSCGASTVPLAGERLEELLAQVPQWKLADNNTKIVRTYKFADWAGAAHFSNRVAELADRQGHHPEIHLSWGKVVVELSTHKIKGLSENDFILATKIDKMN